MKLLKTATLKLRLAAFRSSVITSPSLTKLKLVLICLMYLHVKIIFTGRQFISRSLIFILKVGMELHV